MNYEKIKNDLISEVRLTKNQAEVFLLVTLKGKMSVKLKKHSGSQTQL